MANPAQGKEEKKPIQRASAQKRQLQSEKRRIRNKSTKSRIKTSVRDFREGVEALATPARVENLSELYSQIDRAAKKGVFKQNKVNRLKSRLAANVNKLAARAR